MPTPAFGDADAQAVLDGLGGVPVTVGAVTANGKLRRPDARLAVPDGSGDLGARETSVLVRTATFEGLVPPGTAITVDGAAYKVTEFTIEDAGLYTRVFLARP